MSRFRQVLFATCLAAIGAAAPASATHEAPSGSAAGRVWFLWPSESVVGYDTGAVPTIYVNGAPIGAIQAGTEFYRDFSPGTYRFTVDPYGVPTGQAATLQVAPGSQTFLQVQWSPAWQQGYPGGRGQMHSSFFIVTMSPQLAQAYLPTLASAAGR
jgi:hypothetical protein